MSSDGAYRAGIVGCGGISSSHGDAIEGNGDRIELVGCCDVDRQRAREFADTYSVAETYSDYHAMLDDADLDIVILATWPNQHEEQVLDCVDAGVPAVLCEKSLATDSESAARMARAADDAGSLLMEAFMYRHHPRTLTLLDRIADGAIGDLRSVRAGFHMIVENEDNWRRDPDRAGGVVFDLSCYCVNALGAIVDGLPRRVAAECTRRESDGLVESLWATLRYPDGTFAQIESSQTSSYRTPLEVHGDEGILYLEHAWIPDGHDIERITADWVEDFDRARVPVEAADPYEEQILHLCDCLDAGRTPRMSPAESVRNVSVIDALLESAESGTFVAPDPPKDFASTDG